MKRRIRPVADYEEHEHYPSAREAGVSRRDFMCRAAATTAAAIGAGALSGEADAGPKQKDKRERITLYVDRRVSIGTSGMSVQKLEVFTADKQLARFLRKSEERIRTRTALMRVVRKAKADVLYDGRKLYRFERSLGAVLNKQYRKRTGKRARQPDVMLHVSRNYRRFRTAGVMLRPSYPYRRHP